MRQDAQAERQACQVVVGDIQSLQAGQAGDLVRQAGDLVLPQVQRAHRRDVLQLLGSQPACHAVVAKVQLLWDETFDEMSQSGNQIFISRK